MDTFSTRPKRKNPLPVVEKLTDSEETTIKKLLQNPNGAAEDLKVCDLESVLPKIRTEDNKAISDNDLEKIFLTLCGNTGKEYDSDDSIASELDNMDAEEIAAKDARFREVMASIDTMSDEYERVKRILKIGNETKKEKEERQKLLSEMKDGLMTPDEKQEAEKMRKKKKKMLEFKMKKIVNVFEVDAERKKQEKNASPLITCSVFARLLEAMADTVEHTSDKVINVRQQIKDIDSCELDKRIKYMGIKATFYKEDKTVADYVKKKVRKILINNSVAEIFDKKNYGFDFGARECLLALENYYSLKKPSKNNDTSTDALSIRIRQLIYSCFHVARSGNPSFVLNDTLKSVLFD